MWYIIRVVGRMIRWQTEWEHSSAGRASALQAEGHRFEPYCSHHFGPVVQLVRTPACHAGGRGFEPHPGRQNAFVAQSVEQGTENPRVGGSIPPGGTIKFWIMREWLSGRASPCQGERREFESRLPLHFGTSLSCSFFVQNLKKLLTKQIITAIIILLRSRRGVRAV